PSERLDLLYQTIPPTSDILGWSRLARAVAALHREVSGAGLRFAEVARLTTEGLLFSDTERWSVLAELQASYEADLRHFGFSDRGLARIDALAAGTLSIDQDLWLVGVMEMPRVLMRLIETAPEAATRLTVIVQAPEREAADFDALGCLRTDGWSTRSIPLRDSELAVRDGPAEQTAEVGRFLASLGGE